MRLLLWGWVLLALGCGSKNLQLPASGGEALWPQSGGGSNGLSASEKGPQPPLRLLWEAEVDGAPVGQALWDDGLLLQLTHAPSFYAFDPFDGRRVGKRGNDDLFCGAPALAGPLLLYAEVGSRHAGLRALDRASGKILWQEGEFGCARLTVRGDTVWAASENGFVAALNLSDGETLWRVDTEGPVRVAPSLEGERLYIGDSTGQLLALLASDGQEIWRTRLEAGVRLRPAVDGERVYTADGHGTVAALKVADGEVLWKHAFKALPADAAALADGLLVVGGVDRKIRALETLSGRLRWSFTAEGVVRGAPATNGRTVYCVSGDGYLYALELQSGRLAWKYQVGAPLLAGVSLGQRRLAVVSEEKRIYVFAP